MKKSLVSFSGQLFAFNCYAMLIVAIGIMLYFIIIGNWTGVTANLFFAIFNYLVFVRKLISNQLELMENQMMIYKAEQIEKE